MTNDPNDKVMPDEDWLNVSERELQNASDKGAHYYLTLWGVWQCLKAVRYIKAIKSAALVESQLSGKVDRAFKAFDGFAKVYNEFDGMDSRDGIISQDLDALMSHEETIRAALSRPVAQEAKEIDNSFAWEETEKKLHEALKEINRLKIKCGEY